MSSASVASDAVLKLGLGFILPGDTAPFARTAEWTKEHGFSGIMIGTNPDWSDEETARLGETFASYELEIFELGSYTSVIHEDPITRRRNIDAIKRRTEQAAIIGARCVATTSGTPAEPAPHPATRTQASWDLLVEATREILDVLPEGVSFCLEAWPQTVLYDIPTFTRFYAEIDDPRVGMIFDPANLMTTDNYYATGDMIDATFDALGDRFIASHCKDIEWVSGFSQTALKEVVPGRGSLDYPTFLRRAATLGHDLPLIVEHLGDPEDVIEASAYIRRQAEETGITIA